MNSNLDFWLGIVLGVLGTWFLIRYLEGYGMKGSIFEWTWNIYRHTKIYDNKKYYFTGNNRSELLLVGVVHLIVGFVLTVMI